VGGAWSLGLLGPIEIERDGERVAASGAKLQALIALLALAAPHAVAADRLIDELWDDDHIANPTNALHAQIAQLRRLLGREAVVRTGSGYQLAADEDQVDTARFERLVRDGRAAVADGDVGRAADRLERALALVRGPPLADLADHRFARQAASRLEELIADAEESMAEARLADGRHAEVVVSLAPFVAAHPLRERAQAHLILALYRCGRQADALRAYQEARAVLVEDLGVEPGAELRALERAILAQDPSLDAVPVREPSTEATAPIGSATPPASPLIAGRLPLVGRDAELRALRADLAEVVAGRGRVVVLGGEPGIGKTRLAEDLAALAVDLGAAVAWGRCHDGRGAPAFWPWTQALLGLVAGFDDATVRAALGSGAADLAQIVPEVKELVGPLEPLPLLDPEAARFRLARAVVAFVRRLAADQPVAIVLDDLQWADAPSLELLATLTAELGDRPVLVVATFRTVDPPVAGALADALVDVSRRSHGRRLDLTGLDEDATAQFLAAAGADPSDDAVSTVHRRTQGNPFFVTEILRSLPTAGPRGDVAAVSRMLPASVRDVIRQRIARLPEPTNAAVAAAAVLGHEFEVGVLADVLDADAATVLDALEAAVRVGIVIAPPGGPGRYRFSHGLVDETVYEDLGVAARARHHRRVAVALAVRHGEGDGAHLLVLAEHWFRAVPAAPVELAVEHALRAARWARAHLAHEQAEEQLRVVLELLPSVPAGRPREALELEVLDELSTLLVVTTSYAAEGLDAACARMRELCQAIGDHALVLPALFRLTGHHLMRCDLEAALAVGDQMMEVAGVEGTPGPRLVGHIVLGTILTYRCAPGDVVVAREHLDAAIELCDAGHDAAVQGVVPETPAVCARVNSALNWWLLGEDDRADAVALEAVERAAIVGVDTYSMTYAVWFSSLIATLRRDVEATLERCDRGIALAHAGGFGMAVPYMRINRGWALAVDGRFDEGTADIVEGAAAIRASGARIWSHSFPGLLADACSAAGRHDAALRAADDGLALVADTGERWFAAELHRLRAEALFGRDASDPEAVAAAAVAVAVAREQGALGLVRRAEASVARMRA
jgi:DNA-binding SARP family transcriptional activator